MRLATCEVVGWLYVRVRAMLASRAMEPKSLARRAATTQ
ncbi:hypothetical protein MYA_5343 [Burkholderia sp. KJ006]|nr:hypothetical protein MYA_5343 [Burkholderia sp. KJ006]